MKGVRYGTGRDDANGVLGYSDILKIGPEFMTAHTLGQTVVIRRFPVIFVDESQDTDPSFVDALRMWHVRFQRSSVSASSAIRRRRFTCKVLGLFQQKGMKTLEKPKTFRCPQAVLCVINRIRAEDDQLEQMRGRDIVVNGEDVPVEGSVKALILSADDRRQERLEEARRRR